jgi:hypothetical protein
MKIVGYALFLIVLVSCSKDDPHPEQLLVNTKMEDGLYGPNGWTHFASNFGVDGGTWVTDQSNADNHVLKISLSKGDASSFSAWSQLYSGTTPVGKDATLSVKIKGENLIGAGVAVVIRGDVHSGQQTFYTTEGTTTINQTFDWKTYTLKAPAIPENVKTIHVFFLILPNTTGTAYFDDASLTHN